MNSVFSSATCDLPCLYLPIYVLITIYLCLFLYLYLYQLYTTRICGFFFFFFACVCICVDPEWNNGYKYIYGNTMKIFSLSFSAFLYLEYTEICVCVYIYTHICIYVCMYVFFSLAFFLLSSLSSTAFLYFRSFIIELIYR